LLGRVAGRDIRCSFGGLPSLSWLVDHMYKGSVPTFSQTFSLCVHLSLSPVLLPIRLISFHFRSIMYQTRTHSRAIAAKLSQSPNALTSHEDQIACMRGSPRAQAYRGRVASADLVRPDDLTCVRMYVHVLPSCSHHCAMAIAANGLSYRTLHPFPEGADAACALYAPSSSGPSYRIRMGRNT